jgi:hypothetical protein
MKTNTSVIQGNRIKKGVGMKYSAHKNVYAEDEDHSGT